MTNQNDFTNDAFASFFDVLDVSCLYAARFGLFAPGFIKATLEAPTPQHTRPATPELADALGDF